MQLMDAVAEAIAEFGLLEPGQQLVAAVSGGPDSLCLLDCLRRLGYRPVIAHFDHGLRPESASEAERVASLADRWQLPLERGRADVLAARGGRGSLEEIGRRLRYQFLVEVAVKHQLQVIATGHSADDQVETVLMHLLRGAGASGLQGMQPNVGLSAWVGIHAPPEMRLIRPLLAIWRSDIELYCQRHGLQPLYDPSNLDRRHFRNRLRHELLPLLEDYNPQVRQSLYRTARIMAAERELMEALVREVWPRLVREAGPGCLALDRQAWLAQPLAVRRAVARSMLHKLRPELRDIGFEAVESMLRFAADPTARRMTLVGGLDLLGAGAEVVLRHPEATVRFPWYPQLHEPTRRRLAVPGSLALADGWTLLADRLDLTPTVLTELTAGDQRRQAAIDPANVQGDLAVRAHTPGDRIRPLGMQGSMKVADLFMHRSIPWPARPRWPLLVDDRSVLWVAGLHLSREHCLTASSRQAVSLRLEVSHPTRPPPALESG